MIITDKFSFIACEWIEHKKENYMAMIAKVRLDEAKLEIIKAKDIEARASVENPFAPKPVTMSLEKARAAAMMLMKLQIDHEHTIKVLREQGMPDANLQ